MEKFKKIALVALKGFIVGGSMVVPGVSGGTMAILLKIYDNLISWVNGVFRKDFKGIPNLLFFALGGGAGFFLLSKPLKFLLNTYPYPTSFFFIGAVLGGIPLIINRAKEGGFSWKSIVYCLIGFAIAFSLHFLPDNLLRVDLSNGFSGYIILFLVGVFIAVALVLPGISGSLMLSVLGIYTAATDALHSFDLRFLVPLGLGVLIGIFATTHVLEKAMTKQPHGTYMIITGFLLGSVLELFLSLREPNEITGLVPSATALVILLSILLLLVGAFLLYMLSRFDKEDLNKVK